jgi:hypothetical protein
MPMASCRRRPYAGSWTARRDGDTIANMTKLRALVLPLILVFSAASTVGCIVRTAPHRSKRGVESTGKHKHRHCHDKRNGKTVCHSHMHTHPHH